MLAAQRLVLTEGPWFGPTFRTLGIPLRVERNVQHWFRDEGSRQRLGADRFPVYIVDRAELGRPFYGFPDLGSGTKFAFHGGGAETQAPEALERSVQPAEVEEARRALAEFVESAPAAHAGSAACMYSLTPDQHFAIGLHPDDPSIVLAGGFSGHGFKFSPVVGEIVADLVTRGATGHDIALFDPARFRSAQRVPPVHALPPQPESSGEHLGLNRPGQACASGKTVPGDERAKPYG